MRPDKDTLFWAFVLCYAVILRIAEPFRRIRRVSRDGTRRVRPNGRVQTGPEWTPNEDMDV